MAIKARNGEEDMNEEELDNILISLDRYNLGDSPVSGSKFTTEEHYSYYPELAKVKSNIIEWHLNITRKTRQAHPHD